jgi:hypothetical protein
MATPRSIMGQVTLRLECQETGDDFDPLKDRGWPPAAIRGQFLENDGIRLMSTPFCRPRPAALERRISAEVPGYPAIAA